MLSSKPWEGGKMHQVSVLTLTTPNQDSLRGAIADTFKHKKKKTELNKHISLGN